VAQINSTHEHLDPTHEITLETVKDRAIKGIAILTGRTFFLRALSLVAFGLLGAFLMEDQMGVFFLVSAVVSFLAYFSDIGLAAALIQKKEKVTDIDLKTTFTIQQALVITLVTVLFIATPHIQRIYGLSDDGRLLIYALGVSFFLSSLKTIPSVLLEREIRFNRFVIPEILENIVYNFTVVILAWNGYGIASFTYAVLFRGVVGLIAIYALKPWMPGIAFSKSSLKKLLTFGLPYQLNTFLAVAKDDGLTLLLGGILGTSGIGILGWAQKWAQTPLRLFLDNVTKVTFPAFSRMQDNKEQLEASVTRSIFFVCFLVFPSTVGLLILAPVLVEIIPRYETWRPALIPLALVSVNVVFAAATTQLTNLLNAIGKIKITFKLMVMWTSLTWLLVPLLAVRYGVNGAAVGYSLVGASSIVAIFITRKFVKFSIIVSILKPMAASLVMGAALLALRQVLPATFFSVWILGASGVIVYFVASYLIIGVGILTDAKKGLKAIFNR
jgi:O-antigen/teichoic acid export membrane protein